jgi:hypothetical protein
VTILACLYIAVGSIGFALHLQPIFARHAFHYDDLLVELTEAVAIVSGAWMLRGENWARWLAMAWIAFHVAFSFFDSLQRAAVHTLFFVLFAYLLFRPKTSAYFQRRDMRSA